MNPLGSALMGKLKVLDVSGTIFGPTSGLHARRRMLRTVSLLLSSGAAFTGLRELRMFGNKFQELGCWEGVLEETEEGVDLENKERLLDCEKLGKVIGLFGWMSERESVQRKNSDEYHQVVCKYWNPRRGLQKEDALRVTI